MRYANDNKVTVQSINVQKRTFQISTYENPKAIRGMIMSVETSTVDFFQTVKNNIDKICKIRSQKLKQIIEEPKEEQLSFEF
jgi:ribosomal protein L30/L7E